ncbi:MAG: hypothetical protein H6725_13545 [Sandaracinaceae bacterium]|nr:hypothetical protein [Sandaracinaceae bacterium]
MISPAVGVFPVTLSGGFREYAVQLVIVSPDDVERIETRAIELGDDHGSYSVTGVTADGLHVLGLAVELSPYGGVKHRASTFGKSISGTGVSGPPRQTAMSWIIRLDS